MKGGPNIGLAGCEMRVEMKAAYGTGGMWVKDISVGTGFALR